jgi:DNA polymerase elongation subunit (family B)
LIVVSNPFKPSYDDNIMLSDTIEDILLVELVEKARFSYLPMKLASKLGILRLIDSRITYELLQRDFVIPNKKSVSVSKQHEQIRTLENILEMDKAGMVVSPEIGLHWNVAVLPYCIAGVEDNETMVKKVEGVKPPQRLPSSLTD